MEDNLSWKVFFFPVLVENTAVCSLDKFHVSGQKFQDFLQNKMTTHSRLSWRTLGAELSWCLYTARHTMCLPW